MRILCLPRYGRLGASSRLRTFQYLPVLDSTFLVTRQSALTPDTDLRRLYETGSRSILATARNYLRRALDLMSRPKPDVIWVEKEIFPWLPWPVEAALLSRSVPIVSDYDDAIFHNYDLNRNPVVRMLLGRKIDQLMKRSSLVLAGNDYLAERARNAGARRVEVVPTVVDLERYGLRPEHDDAALRPAIGWIGSPSTYRYVEAIAPMLRTVAESSRARIHIVGARTDELRDGPFEFLPWSEDTEASMVQGMSIGIMPLDDTPWSRGKCGYKLIQYMACGLPVVASPVGVNSRIVEHGVNGFLARTEDEWREALTALLGDPELRHRMGRAGRAKIEAEYSLQVWGPRIADLLKSAVREQAG